MTKECARCDGSKQLSDFPKDRSRPDGLFPWCKTCKNESQISDYQKWTPEQRAKHRERVLKSRYGISHDMLMLLYEQQEGCCAICATPGDPPAVNEKARRKGVLHVEHCHETGRVRGLVCFNCNAGLGHFKDRLDLLVRAAAYLTED